MTNVFSHPAYDDHEQILFVSDRSVGLRGIIALHNTALGPAAGGCRMHPYESEESALHDVLRLARGMTMKSAAADLPLGGGKCVIMASPTASNKQALLRAMARQVQSLAGRYWTAIDVGVSSEDADLMAEECDYIFARASDFEEDFPPSRFTSLGGFHAVRALATHLRGRDDLNGLKVAIQGVGQTGSDLATQLTEHGAQVVVTDVNEDAVGQTVAACGASVVAPDEIYRQQVDIFSPCAMGGILNDKTIPQLQCAGIAGLANNQLANSENGQQLLQRNIAYAPDFVANAGGMMGASMPIFSKPNKEKSLAHVATIFDKIISILQQSETQNIPTQEIAEQMAMDKINSAVHTR